MEAEKVRAVDGPEKGVVPPCESRHEGPAATF